MPNRSLRVAAAALAATLATIVTPAGAEPVATLPPEAALAVASPNVKLVATFPEISAIGATLRKDTLYVTGSHGLAIYDVGLTGLPVPMSTLPLPHWENEDVDTNGKILLVAADHFVGTLGSSILEANGLGLLAGDIEVLYVIDVANRNAPILRARVEVPSAHTVTCILNCRYAWLAGDAGIAVVDLRNPSEPRTLGRFHTPVGNTHDVQVDGQGIAWISGTGGLGAYVPSAERPLAPKLLAGSSGWDNQFIIHNSARPYAKSWKPAASWGAPMRDGELVLVTEEDYLAVDPTNYTEESPVPLGPLYEDTVRPLPWPPPGVPLPTHPAEYSRLFERETWASFGNGRCANDGSFQTGQYRQVGATKRLQPLDSWHLGKGTEGDLNGSKNGDVIVFCSSHYFDERRKVAAVAWYEQGVRFLSVKDPNKIRQVGFWRPRNSMAWATRVVGDYIYVFDFVRGLDILHFTGSASGPTVKAALNPVMASRPTEEWGYACRLPV